MKSSDTSAETPEEGKPVIHIDIPKDDADRIRAEICASMLGWDEYGTAERNDIITAYLEATQFERRQQASLERENAELKKENARLKAANAVMKRLGTSEEVAETIKRYKDALELIQVKALLKPTDERSCEIWTEAKSALEGTNK